MLISPQQYLDLCDEITLLRLKAKTVQQDNDHFRSVISKQNEQIRLLTARLQEQKLRYQQSEQQLVDHINKNSENITNSVQLTTQEQMKFIEQQIQKIKADANMQKIKQLEKKMTENRFKNHQMVDFYQKIQSLYLVVNNTRTVPSINELYKWASSRKAQQVTLPTTNYLMPGTQKSFFNPSKLNISNINKSKLNQSKTISNLNSSKINMNKSKNNGKAAKIEQNEEQNEKKMKKSKVAGKQNMSLQKETVDKNVNLNGTKQQEMIIQIHSTESLTQPVNFDSQSLTLGQNSAERMNMIKDGLQKKQSLIRVQI